MLRKLPLLAGLVFLVSLSTHAQGLGDKVELFGGYSYMRTDSPSYSLNGWELAGRYKVTYWLGGVADFDGHYGSPNGFSSSVNTFLFGPEVSWPARVSPVTHVLFRGAHGSSGGFSDTSWAMAIGGEIDTRLVHGLYWRVIQGDCLPTHFSGAREDNARLSTGIVFKL